MAEMILQSSLSEDEMKQFKWFANYLDCAKDTQGIAILTDWTEFRSCDYKRIYGIMDKPSYIFDYRRILDPNDLQSIGFKVIQLGINSEI